MHEDERHRWNLKVAAQGSTITAQRDELTSLRSRLAEVERERDEHKQRADGNYNTCEATRKMLEALCDTEREKSQRLVECVKLVAAIHRASMGTRTTHEGLARALANVSDLISDEVKS